MQITKKYFERFCVVLFFSGTEFTGLGGELMTNRLDVAGVLSFSYQ